MKYAIIHTSGNQHTPTIPVTVSYGLVRAFASQREAYLYAQEIFGDSFSAMNAVIVTLSEAIKLIAIHCEVRSGRLRWRPGDVITEGKYALDKTRASYREMYPSFVDGYKREVSARKEAIEREIARVNAVKACIEIEKEAAKHGSIGATMENRLLEKGAKPQRPCRIESQTDRELRLAIWKETGVYTKSNQQIKPLGGDEFI